MEGVGIGRIVHYVLTEQDAIEINRRRVAGVGHSENWPAGAQAHYGNLVIEHEHVPMVITLVRDYNGRVNGKCLLDGNDDLWVTSRMPNVEEGYHVPGTWHWPEEV